MKFKEIKDKQSYLKKKYPFYGAPNLTDELFCIHCAKIFIVGDYKVKLLNGKEYIVCPNAPDCNGTVIDWVSTDSHWVDDDATWFARWAQTT
jgi:hypothetical protein